VDRWSERAYQLVVAALLEAGDLVAGRQWSRRCLRALAELGVPPQPRTVALHRRLADPGAPPARARG
jgi:hypothetical protein